MNKKRLLVTGSAGFIFSNFIRQCVYDKHPYELYSVDRITNSSMMNNIYQHRLHEFFIADICDRHIMDKIFEYVKPEIVVHGAAEAAVDASIVSADNFIKSNVLGTQIMVDLSIKYGVEKFVQISTDEVYGALSADDKPWTEGSPINPLNPYSASKASAELIVKAAGNTHKLPFIITRSCNNYGARQTSDKLIPRSIKCILNGEKIPVYGNGKQMREWVHVYDNCNAILKIISDGKIGETYNISTGDELTNIEVINNICNIMGEGKELINHIIPDPRPGHDFRYAIENNKVKSLGWAPVYKFKDGLNNTINWYNSNKFYLKN